MAINNLKEKIVSTIYPNGTGAITAEKHQALLLEVADEIGSRNIAAIDAGKEIEDVDNAISQRITQIEEGLKDKEDVTNKVTSISAFANDTQYPTAKAVLDAMQGALLLDKVNASGTMRLEPNKLYDFGEAASVVVTFEAPASGKVAQYAFQFKSPSSAPTSLTMPDGVVFPVDAALEIKEGLTYQITIVENLAIATSWEV